MNISEAFKHLLDGKKIKHKDTDYKVYCLLGDKITCYRQCNNHYNLFFTDFQIDDKCLNNWTVVDKPYNIRFLERAAITVPQLIKEGYTLKRFKAGKRYNNTDLSDCGFTMEDMEADDWVIED